jgi:hypothetical protein
MYELFGVVLRTDAQICACLVDGRAMSARDRQPRLSVLHDVTDGSFPNKT